MSLLLPSPRSPHTPSKPQAFADPLNHQPLLKGNIRRPLFCSGTTTQTYMKRNNQIKEGKTRGPLFNGLTMGEQKNGKSCFMTGLQVSTGNGTHRHTHARSHDRAHMCINIHMLEHTHALSKYRLIRNVKVGWRKL